MKSYFNASNDNTGLLIALQKDRLEQLLNEAKQLEKQYEWLQAADIYCKVSTSVLEQNDPSKAGEIQDFIGFCYFKAAFQAETKPQFNERMNLAAQAYRIAANLFKEIDNAKAMASADNSNSWEVYCHSWLEFVFSKKKELLEEWFNLKSRVLRAYEKANDQIGIAKTVNDIMEGSYEFRYWIVRNWKEAEKIREELIAFGERAIAISSELADDFELARAYCWTSLYQLSNNTMLSEQPEETIQRGIEYSQKALAVSKKIGNSWLTARACVSALNGATLRNDQNSVLNLYYQLIEHVKICKDAFLINFSKFLFVVYNFILISEQEDPEKNREMYENSVKYAEDVIKYFGIFNITIHNPYYPACVAFVGLSSVELEFEKKYKLLKKAVNFGRKGVSLNKGKEHALIYPIINVFTWALYHLSKIEANADKKKRLFWEIIVNMDKTIRLSQNYPYNYFLKASSQYWMAIAKYELSKFVIGKKKKQRLIRETLLSMDLCVKNCKLCLKKQDVGWLHNRFADFFYSFGEIHSQLYETSKDRNHLFKAIEVFKEAITLFCSTETMTGAAKSHWQTAKIHDQLEEYFEAAKNYESASEAYLEAAKKIPQLKEFYDSHSKYMLAWSQIEKARYHHFKEEYDQAMEHYREAASLHEASKSWAYLAPNYYAWEQMERGEDLSRKEETHEAIQSFKLAMEYFEKAKTSIETNIEVLQTVEEKKLAASLIKASDLRHRYSEARICLEEAKHYERKGDYSLSSKRYRNVSESLEKIIEDSASQEERRELYLIMVLSQAWRKMTLAEGKKSPELFLEAAELFEKAKQYSTTEKTSLWTFGNSSFCKGLAAKYQFQSTFEKSFHSMAIKHVKQAADYYKRAGFQTASDYAKGSQRLFDAYLYMNSAEEEVDPEKKAKFYQLAEQLLQIAAGLFMKAKQPEKTVQVQGILSTIREEKALAASLIEVLHAPSVASSTLSFAAPTPTSEASVGLESLEHANVQANLVTHVKEVKVGESFSLSVEFVNAGKEPALLMRVEEFVPRDFTVVKKPEIYRLEESSLNMKGKQLAPLKLVEAMLVLQPAKKGVYHLSPKVHYLDELGQNKSLQLKSVEIEVEEVILADRLSTGTKELDSLLLGGIPEGYAVVLTGSPSDEREMLIENFLEAGTKKGETSFYVTTEAVNLKPLLENPNFHLFLCNPKPKIAVPNQPNIIKLRSKTDINNLNIALAKTSHNIKQKLAMKRACIETVSDVLLRHGPEVTRRWLSELITDLGSKGFTVLAVVNSLMHHSEDLNAILDLFDGEISVFQPEDPLECRKSVVVKKLRNQDFIKNSICLTRQN